MSDSARTHLSRLFELAPQAASVIAIATGAVVLFGWAYELDPLKSVFPGLVAMKANTALGFILAGASLWTASSRTAGRLCRLVASGCGGAVLLLGLLVLAEYLGGADFGIDQLLFREVTDLPGDIPGRMAASTAVCFAALGTALVLLGRESAGSVRAIHALSLIPILVAGAALVSYGYDIDGLLRVNLNYTPMAVSTAAVFVVLGFGVVNARRDYPFPRIMTSDSAAGITARRLLPAAIGLQLVMGWLLLRGLQRGYLDEAAGLALFAVVNMACLGTLIQWNAARLYQADAKRRQAERARRDSERHSRKLLAELPTAVVVHAPDSSIRYGNASALNLLGLSERQLLGKTAFDPCWHFVREDGSFMPVEEFPVNRVIAENRPLHDYLVGIVRSAGAQPLWAYVNAFPDIDGQGRLQEVVVTFVDITGRKRAEEELQSLQARFQEEAIRDPLTGLYNRRYLQETLLRELARAGRDGHPLSVLMADVDHFKRLNDTYGHPAGDEVLRTLGRLLLRHARSSDIPCRYGGEEFIVVLPEMPLAAAQERAELLRKEFADLNIAWDGTEFSLTMSIGVSVYPSHGNAADKLIDAADRALYEAKNSGRNRVCSADHESVRDSTGG